MHDDFTRRKITPRAARAARARPRESTTTRRRRRGRPATTGRSRREDLDAAARRAEEAPHGHEEAKRGERASERSGASQHGRAACFWAPALRARRATLTPEVGERGEGHGGNGDRSVRQGRTAGGKERERASERAVEGAAVDKRERKYERSRVKRTNKQPRPLASRPQLRVRAAEGEEERRKEVDGRVARRDGE